MKKIVTIAGSNSSTSINKQLVNYAGSLLKDVQVDYLDLRQYDVPIYKFDDEQKDGIPEEITTLLNLLKSYDAYIIATPEHNGSLPAFFKNILDWLSRANREIFGQKPTLVLSTSPGGYGGAMALKTLANMLSRFDAVIKGEYSLVSFYDNYDVDKQQLKSEEEQRKLQAVIDGLMASL